MALTLLTALTVLMLLTALMLLTVLMVLTALMLPTPLMDDAYYSLITHATHGLRTDFISKTFMSPLVAI